MIGLVSLGFFNAFYGNFLEDQKGCFQYFLLNVFSFSHVVRKWCRLSLIYEHQTKLKQNYGAVTTQHY